MRCTGKEQLTCNEEKMGCEGCYYAREETSTQKDIKVLEELIETNKKYGIDICINRDKIQIIENLIHGYKNLEEYKKISELTKISCCTAQNCEALNNAIREGLENNKLKEEIEKRDKMIDLMIDTILKNDDNYWYLFDANKKAIEEYFTKLVEGEKKDE